MSELQQPKLTLYHRNFCLFCARVMNTVKQLGLEVATKNIWRDKHAHQELQNAMGRSTVPVLRIETADGEVIWLPESNDIIRYLQQLSS